MLRFAKMNGAGNDFVMIDNRAADVQLTPDQIVRICDRHRGVGADGVLLVEPGRNGADFRMRYYNADGGEAEMCGNGARCFARFANRIAGPLPGVSFETAAGLIRAQFQGDQVQITMTRPRDLRLNFDIVAQQRHWHAHFINSGVPHVVIPSKKIEDIDVRGDGQCIRRHPMFAPAGANVNFLEKRGAKMIAIRTYERGVEDETLACGTGVVASALVFAASENTAGPIEVRVRGGSDLVVNFRRDGDQFDNVTLTGPAEFVFEGEIDLSFPANL